MIGAVHLQTLACFPFLVSDVYSFPQANQSSNQSRMSVPNHVAGSQPDKLQSPWPQKHLAPQGCVPHCLKSGEGPLISLLRQDCSQGFIQHPSRPSTSILPDPSLCSSLTLTSSSPSSPPITLGSHIYLWVLLLPIKHIP